MISKQLSGPPKPASASARIGREPVALGAAFHMLDLVGALQRLVDLARELGAGIGGIERLVRIHRAATRSSPQRPASPRDRSPGGRRGPSASPGCRRARRAPAPARPAAAAPTASARRGVPAYARSGSSRAASARPRRRRAARCPRTGRAGPQPPLQNRACLFPCARRVAGEPIARSKSRTEKSLRCQSTTCAFVNCLTS